MEMFYDLIEPVLRMVLAFFFAFSAVAGLAGAIHSIALDGELRKLSQQSQEILDGLRDAVTARKAHMDEKKKARQEKLESMV
ncbi:hypothetical protein MNBD_NITROSPINAE04-801 [hydrothermal vent metagenome]|uniref:Uncharacterized protein n=1 Tax=hydrothermal vent metagenome TaxID=652676 RepID=A0A3B1CVC1_9ZZZZ